MQNKESDCLFLECHEKQNPFSFNSHILPFDFSTYIVGFQVLASGNGELEITHKPRAPPR